MFVKGDRCFTEKCSFERRGYAPGEHGQNRRKFSDYGVQLREKQKLKRMFGLLERQFKNYFEKADRQKGVTGSNLLILLERRLDNIVFRMGFANSRPEARQLVMHSHFTVNGKKVNIPSYKLVVGDVVSVDSKGMAIPEVKKVFDKKDLTVPAWLERKAGAGKVARLPKREDITEPVSEQDIVEFYSR